MTHIVQLTEALDRAYSGVIGSPVRDQEVRAIAAAMDMVYLRGNSMPDVSEAPSLEDVLAIDSTLVRALKLK